MNEHKGRERERGREWCEVCVPVHDCSLTTRSLEMRPQGGPRAEIEERAEGEVCV